LYFGLTFADGAGREEPNMNLYMDTANRKKHHKGGKKRGKK
jgi:hypothetical protein